MTLAQKNGNDRVYTPPELAERIVSHFLPCRRALDPCYGQKAFYNTLAERCSFVRGFELDEGLDFLAWERDEHFKPCRRALDPCYGQKAFYNALAERCSFVRGFELDEGLDFLAWERDEHFEWCITNPPWSKLRAFLNKAMECSDNVVFLCLVNAFFMKARQQDMKNAGFGMKEILFVPTPPKPWPQAGFSLGAVHIQRGYTGPVKHSWI